MSAVAFDTLKYAEALKTAGVSDPQAKAQAEALADALRQGGQHLATKGDITELRADLKADIAELRAATKADITELRAATKADITELRAATKADIAELRADLKTGLAELEGRMQAMLNRHLLAIIGAMVGLTAIFSAVLLIALRLVK